MSRGLSADVIVVGAGMVGAAFAALLAQAGRRVALVETQVPATFVPGQDYDLRVSAFSRASQALFQHLGLWASIRERRVSPYRRMQVWDAGSRGEIRFDAADLGEDCLGHIIENRLIQSTLYERLSACESVELCCPAEPEALDIREDGARLRLVGGQVLRAPLVVAADGGQSRLREWMGIDLALRDYGQSGLVCCVSTELGHEQTARQRFLPGGPLAFLPLADGRCSIVWSRPREEARQLLDLEPVSFARQLADALEQRLGAVEAIGPRALFPLRRQHARRYVAPGFALIGDAAHTIHPLAGQGVNLGLLDAAALAEVLLADTGDWGRISLLRRYERWRRGDNEIMLRAMDGFQWLFGEQAPPIRLLRGLGLQLTDRLTPVKLEFMSRAMGLAGDLPAAARPVPDAVAAASASLD